MESRLAELERRLSQANSENDQERTVAQLQLKFNEATTELERLQSIICELKKVRCVIEESNSALKQSIPFQPFIPLTYENIFAVQPSLAIVHCNSDVKLYITKLDGSEVLMATKRSPFCGSNSMACFVNTGEAVKMSRPDFAAVSVEGFLCPLTS